MLEDEHGSRLGQVLSVRLEQRDAAELEWAASGGGPRSGAGWGSASPSARA
jgi:hypothetical protein